MVWGKGDGPTGIENVGSGMSSVKLLPCGAGDRLISMKDCQVSARPS